ncbi:MAG: hypothetical protein V8R40_06240 [Dysosmobacter sp.]
MADSRELDEVLDQMHFLLSSANSNVVAAALTVGWPCWNATLSTAAVSMKMKPPFPPGASGWRLLFKGLACRDSVRQEALRILGEGLFASSALDYKDKAELFTLLAKKVLFLINEQPEKELTFFYTAASLSHVYRFIITHHIESGPFTFLTGPGSVPGPWTPSP